MTRSQIHLLAGPSVESLFISITESAKCAMRISLVTRNAERGDDPGRPVGRSTDTAMS